ncbi:dihydroorotate dehydrogenase [Advenella mimigardefordensis]|uniref:Dihydroorotate dehydrogenase n=1 Tax=Advenella mimigardefordensis (strain DSM 17166 / LMG 22922 / DPN7) TaxID=1247726 RepID=W0PF15_ADVMD|nr:dihydroorotate dehydrogenase [Advenella mimigardefordensis]AHG65231.1 dihydroorotate dehydrogenase catalytic subunit [Advenella mimigardefordensis DPN7]
MVNTTVKIGSLELANPVMPASGTFAEGMAQIIDINRLGAIVTKTITSDKRQGNPPPRIAEFRNSTLFSIGIPSKGADYYIEETVTFYRQYTPPLVASISADSIDQFGELAAKISVPGVQAIEANISCPNLKKNGQAFGMDAEATYQVVRAMKAATQVPIWPKMTPNAANIVEIALAAQEAGADAIVVSNALLAMAIDVDTFLPKVANVMGGITGPAMKPILLRMAHQCAQAVDIPVIGCGGIESAEDAIEYLLAGASAVQVGTANFVSPNTMLQVINDIIAFCERRDISHVSELVGAMRHHEPIRFEGVNSF